MVTHVHRFRALTYNSVAVTKWKCSCGLKVKSRAVAEALDGKPL